MAKTPLLDWLQRDSFQLNRRTFLQTALIAGAGLAGLGALALPELRAPSPKVVVVGAGLAGLTAAYRLRQAGLRPTVLEASNRPGGRVSTERRALGAGLIAERGGEWIEPEHRQIRSLAAALGIALEAVPTGEPPQVWLGGERYPTSAIQADLAALAPALARDWQALGGRLPTYQTASPAARAIDQLSAEAWIERNLAQSRLGRLLSAALSVEWGAEAAHLSAIHAVTALAGGSLTPPTRDRIVGGSDRLTEALADHLGGSLVRQTRLTSLQRAGDGSYRLAVAGPSGTRIVKADQVVLALPLPVLRESVDLSRAGFSAEKLTAMQALGVGIQGKLHLAASAPATFLDDGWGATAPGRPGLLVHWLGGEAGRRLTWGTPGDRGRYLLGHLAKLGALESGGGPAGKVASGSAVSGSAGSTASGSATGSQWQGRAILDDWSNWSPAGGATAFRPPGNFTAHAGREAESEGCCHFAGEWTSLGALGRMEGAVESGERAAQAVIRQLANQAT